MNVLKIINKYLIESQLWVSLLGTCLACFFMEEQKIFRYPTLLLIFITFFSGYLYTKYQSNKRLLYKVLPINLLCGLVSVILIFQNHNEIRLIKWATIIVIGLFYNSIFLSHVVRKIPLIKIFYVGLVWGLINSWLILPQFDFPIFSITFLYISALILPFDIRDVKNDTVLTFPKWIGIQNTKYLTYLLLFTTSVLSTYYLKFNFNLAIYFSCLITGLLTYHSKPENPKLYYSLLVELCVGLPFLFLLLLQ